MDKIKVITGKIGTDDHFRGVIAVSDALRRAGMEVVYLGPGQRIDGIINTIIQEDADVVGLSFLCGGQVPLMRRFIARLNEFKLNHVLIILGGIIHAHEIPILKDMGVAEIFLPGTHLKEITEFVFKEVAELKKA